MTSPQTINTIRDVSQAEFKSLVASSCDPVLIKGLAADWPVVRSAQSGPEAVDRYIRQFYAGAGVGLFTGEPDIGGRFFYDDSLTGFNFERSIEKLDKVLDLIREHAESSNPPSYYVGSTTVDTCLPGFRTENDLDFGEISPLASIWISNCSRISAHYDVPENVACVVAGHRRFTLFPPDQLENLYVGPIDFTPAGQQISLVDFKQPDFERFPRFRRALDKALVADLTAGDALFIPSMWWHHVESFDSLNILVNYWWSRTPEFAGPPVDVLYHALLSLKCLPPEQKKAWQAIFDYYIFGEEPDIGHIPEQGRGVLAALNETSARKLRALLLNRLNR
jgi:hypothetical protein